MNTQMLMDTARAMVADDKGLLAMDESHPTGNKRFAKFGIPQTEEARCAYREWLITTPGLGESIPLTSEQKRDAETNIRGVLEARSKINLATFPLLVWGALKSLRTLIRTTNRIWHSQLTTRRLPLRSLGLLGIIASAALFEVIVPGVARWCNGGS